MILSVKLSPIVVFGDKYAGLFRQERINLAANIPPCRGKRHFNLTHLKGYGSVATTELLAGTDIHTLARQMGNSVLMIERHYSKLTATMAARQLA